MTIISEDDPRLSYRPMEKATTPIGGFCYVVKDHFWCVHPERGVLIWKVRGQTRGSPQANSNEAVCDRFIATMYPWAVKQKIPFVFLPDDPSDYAY